MEAYLQLYNQLSRPISGHLNLREFFNDSVGRTKLRRRICTRDPDYLHSTRPRRLNSCRRIFDNKTIFRRNAQQLRPLQIWLRMRLAIHHIIGRNQYLRDRQAPKQKPGTSQRSRARRDYAPAPLRNRPHQICGSRHYIDAFMVIGFPALDLPHLRFGIKMWSNIFNDFNRAHAVGNRNHLVAIHTLALCPNAPLSVDRACRIDQYTIQIEKNC
jgi:hypothetical protein